MKREHAPVVVAFVLVNVQNVKNVDLVKIINPLNQMKKIFFFSVNFQNNSNN